MADLIVKLYDLDARPSVASHAVPRDPGVRVRRAAAHELVIVTRFIAEHFDERWAGECTVAFARQPVACFIATEQGKVLGFAAYDATARGFFGPLGVAEQRRNAGIGGSLYLACLRAMYAEGYAYAIVGGAAKRARALYERISGAWEIPDSSPGIYDDYLEG